MLTGLSARTVRTIERLFQHQIVYGLVHRYNCDFVAIIRNPDASIRVLKSSVISVQARRICPGSQALRSAKWWLPGQQLQRLNRAEQLLTITRTFARGATPLVNRPSPNTLNKFFWYFGNRLELYESLQLRFGMLLRVHRTFLMFFHVAENHNFEGVLTDKGKSSSLFSKSSNYFALARSRSSHSMPS
jgi:hypothetical protein